MDHPAGPATTAKVIFDDQTMIEYVSILLNKDDEFLRVNGKKLFKEKCSLEMQGFIAVELFIKNRKISVPNRIRGFHLLKMSLYGIDYRKISRDEQRILKQQILQLLDEDYPTKILIELLLFISEFANDFDAYFETDRDGESWLNYVEFLSRVAFSERTSLSAQHICLELLTKDFRRLAMSWSEVHTIFKEAMTSTNSVDKFDHANSIFILKLLEMYLSSSCGTEAADKSFDGLIENVLKDIIKSSVPALIASSVRRLDENFLGKLVQSIICTCCKYSWLEDDVVQEQLIHLGVIEVIACEMDPEKQAFGIDLLLVVLKKSGMNIVAGAVLKCPPVLFERFLKNLLTMTAGNDMCSNRATALYWDLAGRLADLTMLHDDEKALNNDINRDTWAICKIKFSQRDFVKKAIEPASFLQTKNRSLSVLRTLHKALILDLTNHEKKTTSTDANDLQLLTPIHVEASKSQEKSMMPDISSFPDFNELEVVPRNENDEQLDGGHGHPETKKSKSTLSDKCLVYCRRSNKTFRVVVAEEGSEEPPSCCFCLQCGTSHWSYSLLSEHILEIHMPIFKKSRLRWPFEEHGMAALGNSFDVDGTRYFLTYPYHLLIQFPKENGEVVQPPTPPEQTEAKNWLEIPSWFKWFKWESEEKINTLKKVAPFAEPVTDHITDMLDIQNLLSAASADTSQAPMPSVLSTSSKEQSDEIELLVHLKIKGRSDPISVDVVDVCKSVDFFSTLQKGIAYKVYEGVYLIFGKETVEALANPVESVRKAYSELKRFFTSDGAKKFDPMDREEGEKVISEGKARAYVVNAGLVVRLLKNHVYVLVRFSVLADMIISIIGKLSSFVTQHVNPLLAGLTKT